jgi:pyruvate kinase
MARATKTICTIGPASETPEILEALIIGGMDIARFNFSHAKYDEYVHYRDLIRNLAQRHSRQVEILLDLQGPRMRVGIVGDEGIHLKEGETMTFTTDPSEKNAFYIDDKHLHVAIKEKQPIFLANGDMELMVEKIEGTNIIAKVMRGGVLYSRKGVNVPETDVKTPSLTEKDLRDIEFAKRENPDIIALSFVKTGDDIRELRKLLEPHKVKICSKIEIKMALRNIDDIIKESDIIMVARGDLGIELPLEEVPPTQKKLIKKCNEYGKPAIVATEMLMSMVNHHRPTRAEVSDVANAVLDGAWGCMLSDETAFGKHPVEALSYLIRTIEKAEEYQSEMK